MREFTLEGFVGHLVTVEAAVEAAEIAALERAAQVVETEAKAEIGEYQDGAGPFVTWALLAESTLAEKERLGYAPPDNPLLRTGALLDSIQHQVGREGTEKVAYVGSDEPVAEYQELGTQHILPRSFLGGALVRKTDTVLALVGGSVHAALVGESVFEGAINLIER